MASNEASEAGPAPRVSVVVPAYNRERYLAAALDSVLAQSETAWELVVSDDGSTDSTLEIAESYAAKDPRITVISGPNGGAAVARNNGLAATDPRTEFVVLLDSDDVWRPDALASLIAPLEDHPELAASHALARCIDPDDNFYPHDDLEEHMRERAGYHDGRLAPVPLDVPTTFEDLVNENWIVTSGLLLIRRSVVAAVGRYDPATDPADDWDYALRVSRHGGLAFVDRVVLLWRRHDDNLTSTSPRWRRGHFAVRAKTLSDPTNTPEQTAAARLAYVIPSGALLRQGWSELRTRQLRVSARTLALAAQRYLLYLRVAVPLRLRRTPST